MAENPYESPKGLPPMRRRPVSARTHRMVAGILIAGGLAGLAVLKLREGIGFGSIGLPELTLAVAGIGAIYYWTHSQPRES